MTNRDVYDAALALLAEEQDELCEDYAQRAPYILATFFNECREVNAFYRYARHGTVCDGADGELNTELDAEFPLAERFFSAGAFYLAAMLVELENEELCDRLFSRYADAISRIAQEEIPARPTAITDAYGFHCCD